MAADEAAHLDEVVEVVVEVVAAQVVAAQVAAGQVVVESVLQLQLKLQPKRLRLLQRLRHPLTVRAKMQVAS